MTSSSRSGKAGEGGGRRRGQVGRCRGGEVRGGIDDLVLLLGQSSGTDGHGEADWTYSGRLNVLHLV